jgi:tetratricopeptide (TPR) repeat protein
MVVFASWRRLEVLIGLAIAFVSLLFYILTLCPTVSFIDSGELATVACTLGIAHPTGYPLFTILAWTFVHVPLGLRPIYQLNLFAALLCAAGVFVFFRFLVFFLSDFFVKKRAGDAGMDRSLERRDVFRIFVPAVFGTLVLAFSETYWSQALSIEVYSLHVLFLSLLLLLVTKTALLERRRSDEQSAGRYWLLFAFVLGLAFTNHMTTILLAPACLYLYFYVHGVRKAAWRKILILVIPFLIGFSLQAYLPIRASQQPLMDWGNPIDFEKWFWHFTGKVYRVWIFSSTESAAKQFSYFVNTLPAEFAYFPLVFAIIGLVHLFRYRRGGFVFTILLFFGCVLYSINYDIHDIDSYFLLAYFTIAVWATVGAYQLFEYVKNPGYIRIAAAVLIASCAFIVATNYSRIDESSNTLVEQYAADMLKSVEPNGVIISYQWDYFVSAAYYLQLVEHQRPDVVVMDKELLRRTLIAQSRNELNAYLVELNKFERSEPYNPNVIEYRYRNLIRSFIEKNMNTRPVYVTHEIENQYLDGFHRVPSGLAFRLFADDQVHSLREIEFDPHFPQERNIYVDGIIAQYAQAYLNNAIYLKKAGKRAEAISYLKKALEIQPSLQEAGFLMNELGGYR